MAQPFELPDFYVPWPGRLSPNLDSARIQSKAWACKMGVVGDPGDAGGFVWDEAMKRAGSRPRVWPSSTLSTR